MDYCNIISAHNLATFVMLGVRLHNDGKYVAIATKVLVHGHKNIFHTLGIEIVHVGANTHTHTHIYIYMYV